MTETEKVVREFWRLMNTNDFYSVSAVLAPGFILEWPQSGERIRGYKNFAAVNSEYPAHGLWKFTINTIAAGLGVVATDVSVTDGAICARVLSFFTVGDRKITRVTEFWPDPFPAPENRKHLVEKIK